MDCQAGGTPQLKSGGPKMTIERIGSSADSNAVLVLLVRSSETTRAVV